MLYWAIMLAYKFKMKIHWLDSDFWPQLYIFGVCQAIFTRFQLIYYRLFVFPSQ